MKKEKAQKGYELANEIDMLLKYKDIFKKPIGTAHFEIIPHYGNVADYEKIVIQRKHNELLLNVIKSIIKELEQELESL